MAFDMLSLLNSLNDMAEKKLEEVEKNTEEQISKGYKRAKMLSNDQIKNKISDSNISKAEKAGMIKAYQDRNNKH